MESTNGLGRPLLNCNSACLDGVGYSGRALVGIQTVAADFKGRKNGSGSDTSASFSDI